MLIDDALATRPESEIAQLAVAKVLILKGDTPSADQALKVINTLLAMAENDGRMGIVVEALALQALAHWRHNDTVQALTAIEHALRLAQPEGYIRLFDDFGLPIIRLLQDAHGRGVMVDYIELLLRAIDANGNFERSKADLVEPLTERELEILKLIAAGLTNPEIGEELVISSETVKKHAIRIYGKLGVNNRTEAASRARELDLLD
jgi:LuxR family maltose regulon positive regulatory protein